MKILALQLDWLSQKQQKAILEGYVGTPPLEMSADAIKLNIENIKAASTFNFEGLQMSVEGTYRGRYIGSETSKIAFIQITGSMAKNTYIDWDAWRLVKGTQEIIQEITQAEADGNVKGIIFYVDSGGGHVDGTHELGQAIAKAKKPTTAAVSGYCASAAYWVTSQCDTVYATSPQAFVGSIGTLLVHMDQSLYLQGMGVKITHITATKSTEKVVAPTTEPLSEEDRAKIVAMLDPINEDFIATVKSGRGDKLKDDPAIFSAAIFNAKEAKRLGLIDGIKLIDEVIAQAVKSASKFEKENSSQTANTKKVKSENSNSNAMSWYTKMFPNAKTEANAPETLQPEELNAISMELETLRNTSAKQGSQLESLTTQLAEANANIAAFEEAKVANAEATIAMQAEIDTLKAEKEELEARPTAEALETLTAEHAAAIETLTAERTKLEDNYNTLAKKAGAKVIEKSENQGDPDSKTRSDVTASKNNW